MNRAESWLQHLSNFLVITTGFGYAWFKYFAKPIDAYSTSHPMEPRFRDFHVILAPLLVFACGMIWRSHAMAKIRNGRAGRRASGVALVFLLIPMITTGYLIQVSVEENWRKAWVAVHLATGACWSLSYVFHWAALKFTLIKSKTAVSSLTKV